MTYLEFCEMNFRNTLNAGKVLPIYREQADEMFPLKEDSLKALKEWAESKGWEAIYMQFAFLRNEDDMIVLR